MNNKFLILKAFVIYVALSCVPATAELTKPEVELTHWWNQPGELLALAEIKKAVVERGASFVDTPIESWDALRSSIINRISMGYPPAVTQWLAYDNIFELDRLDAIYRTPSVWQEKPLKDVLFKEVYENLSKDGNLVGLPVGIHIQNAALFNAKIYKELELELPTSWLDVVRQAPTIHNAGYVPVALSKETWQLYVVLNTILLEALGPEGYQQLHVKGQSIERWRKPLVDSFQTLISLKPYIDKGARTRNWSSSALMVGEKKAAMHVMGDFAKGELTAKGLVAGKDFLCSLAPGSNGNMIYAIDSFMMLKIDEPHLKKGQEILFDAILNPHVQAAYSYKKGSIPVRHGIDISELDSCARDTYQRWEQTDSSTTRFTGASNLLRTSFFSMTLEKFWNDDNISAEQLVDELIKIDNASL